MVKYLDGKQNGDLVVMKPPTTKKKLHMEIADEDDGIVTHPQALQWTHCKSKGENSKRRKSWGTFPSSPHFGG
jgi:hypothetical protein